MDALAPLAVLSLLAVAAFCFWLLAGDPLFGRVAEAEDYRHVRRMGLSTYGLVLLIAACLSVVLWGGAVLVAWPFWLGMAALGVAPWGATDLRHRFLRWRGDFQRTRLGSGAVPPPRQKTLEEMLREMNGQQARPDGWYTQLGGLGNVTLSDGSQWGLDQGTGQFYVAPPTEATGNTYDDATQGNDPA